MYKRAVNNKLLNNNIIADTNWNEYKTMEAVSKHKVNAHFAIYAQPTNSISTHIKFSFGPFRYQHGCNGWTNGCCNIPSGHSYCNLCFIPAGRWVNLPKCPHSVHTATKQYNQTYEIIMKIERKKMVSNKLFTLLGISIIIWYCCHQRIERIKKILT